MSRTWMRGECSPQKDVYMQRPGAHTGTCESGEMYTGVESDAGEGSEASRRSKKEQGMSQALSQGTGEP